MRIFDILNKYPGLPKKFLIRFGLYCAEDVRHLIVEPYISTTLETIQLWMNDKIAEREELYKMTQESYAIIRAINEANANNDLWINAYYAVYALTNALSTQEYLTESIPYVAFYVGKALNVPIDKYKNKLLEMIDELTDLEKLLYLK